MMLSQTQNEKIINVSIFRIIVVFSLEIDIWNGNYKVELIIQNLIS